MNEIISFCREVGSLHVPPSPCYQRWWVTCTTSIFPISPGKWYFWESCLRNH
jgi:hypothetical protein